MSLRVCTAEGWMLSNEYGLEFADAWFPRLIAEQFSASAEDGDVDRAPDQLPFIDAEFLWTNTTDTVQHVAVAVHRGPRSFVTTNPNTIAFDDATSWDVADSPSAPRPSMTNNGVGGRVQVTRPSNQTMQFGYLLADRDDGVFYDEIGFVEPEQTLHYRYMGLFSTPGTWRVPENPRYEMYARWVRLRAWASPAVDGVV